MFQAADSDGEFFDFLSPFDDCGVSPEVGVSRGGRVRRQRLWDKLRVLDNGRISVSSSFPSVTMMSQ